MPEATAQLTISSPEQKPIKIDDRLSQIRQSIGVNSDLAVGNKGTAHDPVPVIEKEIPIQVPSGETQITESPGNLENVASPESFNRPESNFINHMVHGVDRTGEAGAVNSQKTRRELLVQQVRNNPSSQKGLLEVFKDFFYDYDQDQDEKAA